MISCQQGLTLVRVGSFEEYAEFASRMGQEYAARRRFERGLIADRDTFTVPGRCVVCQREELFQVDFEYSYEVDGALTPNWRERLTCPHCGLNNRMRAAMHILQQECAPRPGAALYITEQTTSLFRALQRRYPGIVGSEYLGDSQRLGPAHGNGIRNEDLTQLTFESSGFDHILSFDVFEHVPGYRAGFGECLRCLKPGGKLIFSVPFTKERGTLVRARKNPDGSIVHLLQPEYHGDPLSKAGCLTFYHFGWDLLDDLRRLGFRAVAALLYWSVEFGYLGGGEQMIFMASKPEAA